MAAISSIDTLSHTEGAEPVYWESEDGMSYTMQDGTRQQHGTTITLHIMEGRGISKRLPCT